MSERQFDPVEAMGHDGAEIKRLRALLKEARGYVHICAASNQGLHFDDPAMDLLRRIDAALEKR